VCADVRSEYGATALSAADALRLSKFGAATRDNCARISVVVLAVLVCIFTPVIIWAAISSLSGQVGTSTGLFSTSNNNFVVTPSGACVILAPHSPRCVCVLP
jgi:hypothetical protein